MRGKSSLLELFGRKMCHWTTPKAPTAGFFPCGSSRKKFPEEDFSGFFRRESFGGKVDLIKFSSDADLRREVHELVRRGTWLPSPDLPLCTTSCKPNGGWGLSVSPLGLLPNGPARQHVLGGVIHDIQNRSSYTTGQSDA